MLCQLHLPFFVDVWGSAHATSSPRYPQSNGLAERSVGIVTSMWHKSRDKDAALLAYRSTPLKSAGYSLGDLMYGRVLRSPLELSSSLSKTDYEAYERSVCEHRESKFCPAWCKIRQSGSRLLVRKVLRLLWCLKIHTLLVIG